MRILILSRGDVFPPTHGAAVKIVRTAEALAGLGQTVFFVSDDRGIYHRFDARGRRELRFPGGVPGDRGVAPVLDGLLAAQGVPAEDRFLFSPMIDLDFWRRARWVARRHAVEVAQAEFPAYAAPALAVRATMTSLRTLIVEHNVEHLRIADSAGIGPEVVARLRAWEVALCRAVDRVVTVSENDRRLLVEAGVPGSRIRVLPHGVDLHRYRAPDRARARRRLGLGANERVLIFHGVLNYPPNRDAAIRLGEQILPLLRARGLRVRVLVIGDNPPRDRGGDGVIWAGCVPPEQLAESIACADVAVVPLLHGGGTRMKILEYFAAGLPVISTRKGAEGLPLAGGEIWLADSDQQIADAVAALLEDADRARDLGAKGRDWVKQYDWSEIGRGYLKLYREILPGGPRS